MLFVFSLVLHLFNTSFVHVHVSANRIQYDADILCPCTKLVCKTPHLKHKLAGWKLLSVCHCVTFLESSEAPNSVLTPHLAARGLSCSEKSKLSQQSLMKCPVIFGFTETNRCQLAAAAAVNTPGQKASITNTRVSLL